MNHWCTNSSTPENVQPYGPVGPSPQSVMADSMSTSFLVYVCVHTCMHICVAQSASSLPDGSYRGGRRKEPPPPNMTTEQQLMWEQERDKKDKHNDSTLHSAAVHLLARWSSLISSHRHWSVHLLARWPSLISSHRHWFCILCTICCNLWYHMLDFILC